MSSKENNFKEQFKQALISTAKVISEGYNQFIK
jgi:cobaltochelatase CobT